MRLPILLALGPALISNVAHAETFTGNETVVHDTTSIVEVALNADTVLCSSADYGALFLKVGIPELARITLLDHQNIGAGAPCVAAGTCVPGNMPEDILDPAKPTELVSIHVKAVRFDEADAAAQTCSTHLIERVHLTIRGTEFTHERFAQLGTRPFADCVTTPAAPVAPADDGKLDGSAPDEAPSAGCTTTGSSSFGWSLLVLALIVGRRGLKRV